MKGAESLLRALAHAGVDTYFANPGTSEIDIVAAFDHVAGLRVVPTLFEGVATGAADGYGRMLHKPAVALLHLAPGLAHGLGNLHNARRAHTPVIAIVGEHPRDHRQYDSPLGGDLRGMAEIVSSWVATCEDPERLPEYAQMAAAAARKPPGHVASLIVPTDVSWSECDPAGLAADLPLDSEPIRDDDIQSIAEIVASGDTFAFLLGGSATLADPLRTAARVAAQFGASLYHDTLCTRLTRGAGLPRVKRFPFYVDDAYAELKETKHLILVGTVDPVLFLAQPEKPSRLVPEGCEVHTLAKVDQDASAALQSLAAALSTPETGAELVELSRPELPTGNLDANTLAQVLGALLPENAIVSDESITSGFMLMEATEGCPQHDWLFLTGGCLGQGVPVGIGAAIACPDRKVVCLEGDGSSMYTIQSLWTAAREQLDVTIVVFANRAYAILQFELARATGSADFEPTARDLLDLSNPTIDFVALAKGLGIEASRVATSEDFARAFGDAMEQPGPKLIEVAL